MERSREGFPCSYLLFSEDPSPKSLLVVVEGDGGRGGRELRAAGMLGKGGDAVPSAERAGARPSPSDRAQRGGLSPLIWGFFFAGGIQCDEFKARASATL